MYASRIYMLVTRSCKLPYHLSIRELCKIVMPTFISGDLNTGYEVFFCSGSSLP